MTGKEKYLGDFVVETERKRILVRSRRRWKDNTKARYSGNGTGGDGRE